MDNGAIEKLRSAYNAYCESGADGLDGWQWVKLCRDSGQLTDAPGSPPVAALTTVDCDIIFAKSKARGARRLDFNGFCIALDLLSQKRSASVPELISSVAAAAEAHGAQPARREAFLSARRGPERFFYDTSTYTGTHSRGCGGPLILDGGGARSLDLSEVVDRSRLDRSLAAPQPPPPLLVMSRSTSKDSVRPRRSLVPGRPSTSQGGPALRGPERFFYDTATYTGMHRKSAYVPRSASREPAPRPISAALRRIAAENAENTPPTVPNGPAPSLMAKGSPASAVLGFGAFQNLFGVPRAAALSPPQLGLFPMRPPTLLPAPHLFPPAAPLFTLPMPSLFQTPLQRL